MENDRVRDIDLLNKYRDFENIASRAGLPPELVKPAILQHYTVTTW